MHFHRAQHREHLAPLQATDTRGTITMVTESGRSFTRQIKTEDTAVQETNPAIPGQLVVGTLTISVKTLAHTYYCWYLLCVHVHCRRLVITCTMATVYCTVLQIKCMTKRARNVWQNSSGDTWSKLAGLVAWSCQNCGVLDGRACHGNAIRTMNNDDQMLTRAKYRSSQACVSNYGWTHHSL